jgi:RNA-directed DNA polymerase
MCKINDAQHRHRWPSQRAVKRLREVVRDRTGRGRAGTRIEWVIEDLNPILRGWGDYFRTGNAAAKFRQLDRHVVWWCGGCAPCW